MKPCITVIAISYNLCVGLSVASWAQPADSVRTRQDRERELQGILDNYRANHLAPIGPVDQAPNTASGLPAPIVSTSVTPAIIAARMVLPRLTAGEMSVSEAWQKKALSHEGVLWILGEYVDAWGGFDWKKNVTLRRELARVAWENGGAEFQAQALAPKVLSRPLRLWLADYLGSVGDERAVAMCEQILNETPVPATGGEAHGDKPLVFQTVERLGWFYRDKAEHVKSAQAWLRMKPMFAEPGWWVPDAMLEAARQYGDAGQTRQSHALYNELIAGDNQDFAGSALWEHGNLLIRQGEVEKAQQLLLQQEPKPAQPVRNKDVMAASLLGYVHYLKGDWQKARQYYEQCLALTAQLATLEQKVRLKMTAAQAEQMLRLIDQWQTRPLVSDPPRIDIAVGRNLPDEPLTRRFLVSMFRELPLTIRSTNPQLEFRVEDSPWAADAQPLQFEKQVVVSIPPSLLGKGLETDFVVGSTQLPQYQLHIPLKITKAHE